VLSSGAAGLSAGKADHKKEALFLLITSKINIVHLASDIFDIFEVENAIDEVHVGACRHPGQLSWCRNLMLSATAGQKSQS
jgi:hypothetical protein